MSQKDVVIFKNDDGKLLAGMVEYNENWYEDWKKNNNSPEILKIYVEDGDLGAPIAEEGIPETVMGRAKASFKQKTGMSWEEYKKIGYPKFSEIRGKRRAAGIIDCKADVEKIKEELDKLQAELDKINNKDKNFNIKETGEAIFYNKDNGKEVMRMKVKEANFNEVDKDRE